MFPRIALMTTSKLSLSKETTTPSSRRQSDAPGGNSHVPRSESNCQELAGLAVSQLPICQLASGGLEEKCCINCVALCRRTRLVSRSRGVSTPLGRNREKKLSRLGFCMPSSCGDSRREWPGAGSGSVWLPEWNSPPERVVEGGRQLSINQQQCLCSCSALHANAWLSWGELVWVSPINSAREVKQDPGHLQSRCKAPSPGLSWALLAACSFSSWHLAQRKLKKYLGQHWLCGSSTHL